MTTIDWLLEGDPAIRWQVLRDLTDAPTAEVEAERARVEHEGWGAQLLAAEDPDGLWAGGACFPASYTGGEPGQPWTPYAGVPGVNHLAYEVDDVEALRERLRSAGYRDSTVPNRHPYRKRVYFYDADGNDWEFVQYLSDDPAKRHDYKVPDK